MPVTSFVNIATYLATWRRESHATRCTISSDPSVRLRFALHMKRRDDQFKCNRIGGRTSDDRWTSTNPRFCKLSLSLFTRHSRNFVLALSASYKSQCSARFRDILSRKSIIVVPVIDCCIASMVNRRSACASCPSEFRRMKVYACFLLSFRDTSFRGTIGRVPRDEKFGTSMTN